MIVNWNNRPAPDVGAGDANFAYGPVQRVELLTTQLAKKQKHTLTSVTSAMNQAATQDLRATLVWPLVRDVLRTTSAPTSRADAAAALVDAWVAAGGSRLDADLDGRIDAPGAAVLDTAWPGLADAILEPLLGTLSARLAALIPRSDDPSSVGSAYGAGWYGYVDKDLRTLLGRPVRGAYSRRYCGAAEPDACRRALWDAIDRAAAELEAVLGPDPSKWRADATRERIRFTSTVFRDSMRWTNRPTFQQLLSFSGHRPR
jgi:hypothetical protein